MISPAKNCGKRRRHTSRRKSTSGGVRPPNRPPSTTPRASVWNPRNVPTGQRLAQKHAIWQGGHRRGGSAPGATATHSVVFSRRRDVGSGMTYGRQKPSICHRKMSPRSPRLPDQFFLNPPPSNTCVVVDEPRFSPSHYLSAQYLIEKIGRGIEKISIIKNHHNPIVMVFYIKKLDEFIICYILYPLHI